MDFKERIGHIERVQRWMWDPTSTFHSDHFEYVGNSNASDNYERLDIFKRPHHHYLLMDYLHACYCLQINLYVCTETYPQPFITLLLNTLTIPTRISMSVSLATPCHLDSSSRTRPPNNFQCLSQDRELSTASTHCCYLCAPSP